jgi:hypothetical protein
MSHFSLPIVTQIYDGTHGEVCINTLASLATETIRS